MSKRMTRRNTGEAEPGTDASCSVRASLSTRVRPLLKPVLVAVGSGLAVALAFPHFDAWPLAWVAYIPLLLVIEGASSRRTFLLSWLAGTTANFIGFFWMSNMLNDFGHLPYPVSVALTLTGAAWQGISIALAFWVSLLLAKKAGTRPWPFLPLAYSFFEFLHPILFPWFLGNCQYKLLPLIQVCDLFGISFLTFLLVLANAVLYEVVRTLHLRHHASSPSSLRGLVAPVATLSVVLTAVVIYGFVRLDQVGRSEAQAETLKLGVVEPEIPIFEEQLRQFPKDESPLWVLKWNTLSLQHASIRLVAESNPDLLVWPESTYFPALSVYARRQAVDFVTLAGRSVLLFGPDRGPPISFDADQPLQALASRGDGRALGVGTDGAVYAIDRQGLTREPTPVKATLSAIWYACQATPAYLDTPQDQCLPMAAGAAGTLLARSNDGWVKLRTDSTTDLLALGGFGAGRYVAAGKGEILVGNVADGVTTRLPTPDISWIAVAGGEPAVVLLSNRGDIAKVASDGTITVSPKKLAFGGDIRAMDVLPDGTLVVATSVGLRLVGRELEPRPLHSTSMVSVSCDADGRCLALADDGSMFELTPEGKVAQVALPALAASQGNPPALPTAVAIWPFSRYYWWLPEDASQVYQAGMPASAKPEYPAAVVEDLGQPERTVNAIQRGFRTPILFGATSGVVRDIEDPNSLRNIRYNSAFLADSDGRIQGRYDKQYLLAFGEYIPFGDWFPFLYDWSPESGRFLPGPAMEPLLFKGHKLGVLICYEDIIPGHTNSVAAAGAEALINLTNDAWFGKTKEAWQHFVLAAFRAVEQRLPLVRATTTGISGFVSPTGEIRYMTDPFGAETFTVDLPLMTDSWTVYRAGGRHFPWVAGLLLAGLALAIRFNGTRNAQKHSASEGPSRRRRS